MASTTETIRLGPADHGRRMSLEEFLDAEETPGYRYELARGVVEVVEVPNDDHGYVVCNIYNALALYHRDHPGRILRYGGASEFRLWLPTMVSGRNPDAAVVVSGTAKGAKGRRPPRSRSRSSPPGPRPGSETTGPSVRSTLPTASRNTGSSTRSNAESSS